MRDSGFNRMTPVVLINDDPDPHAMAWGFEAGASFFLHKPIDKGCLLRLVRATQGAIEHERRRTRRVPLRSRVPLRIGEQEIEGETVDVSMEGLLVRAPRTVPVGSSVDVCLHLSKEMQPVRGAGCVVRLPSANQMGIHLGRMVRAESRRLQEFLLSRIPAVALARFDWYLSYFGTLYEPPTSDVGAEPLHASRAAESGWRNKAVAAIPAMI